MKVNVLLYIKVDILSEFIRTGNIPDGEFLSTFLSSFSTVGSYVQIVVGPDQFLHLKENGLIKYN